MLCEKCGKNENVYSFEVYEEYEIPAEYDFICVDCAEEYKIINKTNLLLEMRVNNEEKTWIVFSNGNQYHRKND